LDYNPLDQKEKNEIETISIWK